MIENQEIAITMIENQEIAITMIENQEIAITMIENQEIAITTMMILLFQAVMMGLWKAHASKKKVSKYEKEALQYTDALKEKFLKMYLVSTTS